MKPLPETENVSDDTVQVASTEQNVLPVEKRPLEESEVDDEGERKKCKIDDDQSTEPAMSKRQLKKIEKQKKWLELKAKRR